MSGTDPARCLLCEQFFLNGTSQGVAFTDLAGPVVGAIALCGHKDKVELLPVLKDVAGSQKQVRVPSCRACISSCLALLSPSVLLPLIATVTLAPSQADASTWRLRSRHAHLADASVAWFKQDQVDVGVRGLPADRLTPPALGEIELFINQVRNEPSCVSAHLSCAVAVGSAALLQVRVRAAAAAAAWISLDDAGALAGACRPVDSAGSVLESAFVLPSRLNVMFLCSGSIGQLLALRICRHLLPLTDAASLAKLLAASSVLTGGARPVGVRAPALAGDGKDLPLTLLSRAGAAWFSRGSDSSDADADDLGQTRTLGSEMLSLLRVLVSSDGWKSAVNTAIADNVKVSSA